MTKTVETQTATTKATNVLRKGTLAYIGLYGTAYTRAQTRFTQLKTSTDVLFNALVARGEVIEGQAGTYFKTAQSKVKTTVETGTEKVRGVLPKASNDRVSELETEVATLNKKIAAMAKKAKAPAKAVITEKTVKAA